MVKASALPRQEADHSATNAGHHTNVKKLKSANSKISFRETEALRERPGGHQRGGCEVNKDIWQPKCASQTGGNKMERCIRSLRREEEKTEEIYRSHNA